MIWRLIYDYAIIIIAKAELNKITLKILKWSIGYAAN